MKNTKANNVHSTLTTPTKRIILHTCPQANGDSKVQYSPHIKNTTIGALL